MGVFRFIVRNEKYSVIVAGGVAGLFALLAPQNPLYRVWWGLGYSMLLPILVVGRCQTRLQGLWLREALLHSSRIRLIAFDWLVVSLHALLAAFAISRGHWASFLTSFAWVFLVLAIADVMDRQLVQPGRVWVATLVVVTAFIVSPILMAPAYGNTPFAPHVVTYTVGLHPGAMYLTAQGLPTLQNPILYAVSLVGVIEAYPVRWQFGVGTYFALAVVSIAWSFVVPLRRKFLLR